MKSQKLKCDIENYSLKLISILKNDNFSYSLIYSPTCYIVGFEDKNYDFTKDYIYD